MQLQITLNKANSLSSPVIILADNDHIEVFTRDVEALEKEHPEIFEMDDLFDQVDAFGEVGFLITDCHALNNEWEE